MTREARIADHLGVKRLARDSRLCGKFDSGSVGHQVRFGTRTSGANTAGLPRAAPGSTPMLRVLVRLGFRPQFRVAPARLQSPSD